MIRITTNGVQSIRLMTV